MPSLICGLEAFYLSLIRLVSYSLNNIIERLAYITKVNYMRVPQQESWYKYETT